MFQLREEHMRALERVAEENFVDRGVAHLREYFPDLTAGVAADSLRARIRRGAARARQYDLETEQQIMCFVDSGMMLGEDFDSDPNHDWARQILERRQYTADTRSQALLMGANRFREQGGGAAA